VQEHPVLTASLVAAGFGLVTGAVMASVVPRRRPQSQLEQAVAVARTAAERASEEGLGAAAKVGPSLLSGWFGRMGRASLDSARMAVDELPVPAAQQGVTAGLERTRHLGQLVPIGVALLRNPIVRDLAIHAITTRIRQNARR
jgi:hypothetical protein